MINVGAGIILVLLLLFYWSLVKAGSDADDRWEEMMRETKGRDNDVY